MKNGQSSCAPAIHVERPHEDTGSWLEPGIVPAIAAIQDAYQPMEYYYFPLFLCNSAFWIIF